MLLTVRAAATYDLTGETFVVLMVEPLPHGRTHQVRREQLLTTPVPSCLLRHDLYGNAQRHILAHRGPFSFEFTATVETAPNVAVAADAIEHPPQEIPADVLIYTLPSRFCQSDLFTTLARDQFGSIPPGGGRVQAIADWVRTHVDYRPDATDPLASADDTARERVGACRDFAHLVIAFCRALGIPARHVSAYALGLEPGDYHAYAQVYLGGLWHNVDATCEDLRPALVPIAIGRDSADVARTRFSGPNVCREEAVEVREVTG
jgi:transglutaminase-like putative cysteine protease